MSESQGPPDQELNALGLAHADLHPGGLPRILEVEIEEDHESADGSMELPLSARNREAWDNMPDYIKILPPEKIRMMLETQLRLEGQAARTRAGETSTPQGSEVVEPSAPRRGESSFTGRRQPVDDATIRSVQSTLFASTGGEETDPGAFFNLSRLSHVVGGGPVGISSLSTCVAVNNSEEPREQQEVGPIQPGAHRQTVTDNGPSWNHQAASISGDDDPAASVPIPSGSITSLFPLLPVPPNASLDTTTSPASHLTAATTLPAYFPAAAPSNSNLTSGLPPTHHHPSVTAASSSILTAAAQHHSHSQTTPSLFQSLPVNSGQTIANNTAYHYQPTVPSFPGTVPPAHIFPNLGPHYWTAPSTLPPQPTAQHVPQQHNVMTNTPVISSSSSSLLPSAITALAQQNKANHTTMSIFIGKWDGKSDFQQWALPLISALRVYGLDVYLNPNYPFPGSVQEQFLYSQNSFLVFYVLQRHLPSTDAAVINLFTSHPNPALRAWTYLVRNHCPSTPEMLHNLEVQLKGEKMQEKETARDYISKKIALRLEIERKGGVIPDVAFMVAVLKGLPDHPRFHNLKDNLLDSAELYRTDLGDLCNRIIRVAQSVYGTDYSVGSRSVSAPSLPSILGELHPLGTGPSGSSLSVSDLSVNSARVMQGQMTGSSSSSGQYTPRFTGTCHYPTCGKLGHKWYECHKRARENPS